MGRWDSHRHQPLNPDTQIPVYNVTDEEKAYWNSKQDALRYDPVPTQNSDNALKSAAVYTAIENAKDAITTAYRTYFTGAAGGLGQVSATCAQTQREVSEAVAQMAQLQTHINAAVSSTDLRAEQALSYRNSSADSAAVAKMYAQRAFDSANRVQGAIDTALTAAENAETAAEAAQASASIIVHPPYIGENNNWYTWSASENAYVDSGIQAHGDDGYSPAVTMATIPGGHEITITDKDHPLGQSFNVMDGTGDMLASVYDPASEVADAGSIPAYVASQIPDISGKADKVSNPTSGNFVGFDSNGNLTDSGSKPSDFLTSQQDISGKADKVPNVTSGEIAVLTTDGNIASSGINYENGYIRPFDDSVGQWDTSPTSDSKKVATSGGIYEAIYGTHGAIQQSIDSVMHGLDSNGTVVLAGGIPSYVNGQVSGKLDKYTAGSSADWDTVPTQNSTKPVTSGGVYAEVAYVREQARGKADKVSGATSGDLASLDSNGNLTDSGYKPSAFLKDIAAATNPSGSDGMVDITYDTANILGQHIYPTVNGWDKLVGKWTQPVQAAIGARSVALSSPYGGESNIRVEPYCDSGGLTTEPVPIARIVLSASASSATIHLEFNSALTRAYTFSARVTLV